MELYRIRSLSSFTYNEGGIDRAEGCKFDVFFAWVIDVSEG